MPELTDWRGNKIEVGDVILYAVKHSCSVEVNEGIVSEIGETDRGWMSKPQTYVKVDWSRSSDREWSAKWRKIKAVTLTNLEVITVLAKADAHV